MQRVTEGKEVWKCNHCENEAGKETDEESSVKGNQQYEETEEVNQGSEERPTNGYEQQRDEGERQAGPDQVKQKCLNKDCGSTIHGRQGIFCSSCD